jgi:hypothetical protein
LGLRGGGDRQSFQNIIITILNHEHFSHDTSTFNRNNVVNSIFVLWMQSTKLKIELIAVQGYQTEKKISIPLEQHSHFENHLSLLQDTGSNDDHME